MSEDTKAHLPLGRTRAASDSECQAPSGRLLALQFSVIELHYAATMQSLSALNKLISTLGLKRRKERRRREKGEDTRRIQERQREREQVENDTK